MKRIYLIRHGKAEDGFDKSDFERDLLPKGKRKTEKIAHYLAKKNAKPEQILVSMAYRTLQTADIIMEVLGLNKQIVNEQKSLYLASSNSMLDAIYATDDHIQELMLIGHNPGISSLATYLSNIEIDWMSTSAVVAVDLDIKKWTDISQGKKKHIFHVKPSNL